MQKKGVLIIYGLKPRTHTKPLFEDVKILGIFQMNKYLIGMFTFNVYKSTSLDMFMSMFVYNSSIHDHDTRQSSHFHAPQIKKEIFYTGLQKYQQTLLNTWLWVVFLMFRW